MHLFVLRNVLDLCSRWLLTEICAQGLMSKVVLLPEFVPSRWLTEWRLELRGVAVAPLWSALFMPQTVISWCLEHLRSLEVAMCTGCVLVNARLLAYVSLISVSSSF